MILPLCLAVDPGHTAAAALIEPIRDARPRLLALRVIPASLDDDAWADRAILVFSQLAKIASGRRTLIRVETTRPSSVNGWQGINALAMRRGDLRQAAWGGGFSLADFALLNSQSWAKQFGISNRKLGDGRHRIAEAERFVEMPADTLRGLDAATVDAAEALLMGAAMAQIEMGIPAAEKPKRAAKPRKGRKAA